LTPKKLLITIAVGLFAVLIFPFLFMALVFVFAVRILQRWRSECFADDEFV
jgi:hypothetical protein